MDSAAGANSSVLKYAYIVSWMMHAVKDGWTQSCQMFSVTCIFVGHLRIMMFGGVNNKIL